MPPRCRTCGERNGPSITEMNLWQARHRKSCETWDRPENLRKRAAELEADVLRLRRLADEIEAKEQT